MAKYIHIDINLALEPDTKEITITCKTCGDMVVLENPGPEEVVNELTTMSLKHLTSCGQIVEQ